MCWISQSQGVVELQFDPASTWLQNLCPSHETRLISMYDKIHYNKNKKKPDSFQSDWKTVKRGVKRPTKFFTKPAGVQERKRNLLPPSPLGPPVENIGPPALNHYVWEKRGQTTHEVFLTKQSELIQDNESVKTHRRADRKVSVFELDLGMLLLLSRFSRVQLCATHRRQPTRLLCPWDSPDKNTRVGCHFLLQCMHAC